MLYFSTLYILLFPSTALIKVLPGPHLTGKSEPYPELQAVVATLSTGPVGPSDKIGCSDAKLIMRSVNSDGLILKPDRPARAIDDQIVMVSL